MNFFEVAHFGQEQPASRRTLASSVRKAQALSTPAHSRSMSM